jgi:hypothetical protein
MQMYSRVLSRNTLRRGRATERERRPSDFEGRPSIIHDRSPNVHHETLEVAEVMDAQKRGAEHLTRHEEVADVSPRKTASASETVTGSVDRMHI